MKPVDAIVKIPKRKWKFYYFSSNAPIVNVVIPPENGNIEDFSVWENNPFLN